MKWVLLFCFLLCTPHAWSQKAPSKIANTANTDDNYLDAQTELVLKSISERYEKLRSWSAKFGSTNSSAALGTARFSEGEFLFSYPNRFRFALNGPSEISDFISNGKEAWYARYPKGRKEPALVQYFKDIGKLELDKYLILLKGLPSLNAKSKADLLKTFKMSSSVNEKHIELILEPRRSDDLARVKLIFEQNKEYPEAAQIQDTLGGETLIKITKAQKIERVKAEEFAPKFPKGSQVEEF
jgi:outer membrane lipoprotein-sorting protein